MSKAQVIIVGILVVMLVLIGSVYPAINQSTSQPTHAGTLGTVVEITPTPDPPSAPPSCPGSGCG